MNTDVASVLKSSPDIAFSLIATIFSLVSLSLGIAVVSTEILFTDPIVKIQVGTTLAAISAPLFLIGVYTLFPASTGQKIGLGIGLALTIIGVGLFLYSYPDQWFGDAVDNTPIVATVYSLGLFSMLVYLFIGVANLQAAPPSSSAGRRVPARRDEGPKSALDILKEIFLRKVARDKEDDFDPADAIGAIEEDMENPEWIEDLRVKEEDENVIEFRRSGAVREAVFETSLPQYVDIIERDGEEYQARIIEETFIFQNPEMA